MSSGGTAHSSVTRLESDASASHGFEFCSWYALRNGRCVANAFEGHEWGTYVALEMFLCDGTRDGLRPARARVTELQ